MESVYEAPCPGCEGTGRVPGSEWAEWLAEYRHIESSITDPVTRLAALADHAQTQPQPTTAEYERCPDCDGDGHLLTEVGKQLVEFLVRTVPELVDRHLEQAQRRREWARGEQRPVRGHQSGHHNSWNSWAAGRSA